MQGMGRLRECCQDLPLSPSSTYSVQHPYTMFNRYAPYARFAITILITLASINTALAQLAPIERVKLTDNDLSCEQMHNETLAMDRAIGEAKQMEAKGQTTQTAGVAGSVATEVVSRTGGFFGALGGIAGHVIGTVAGQTASSAAQQSGKSTVQQAQEHARQASARKEHVASLFLKKGCRANDLAYNPPMPDSPQQAMAPSASPATGTTPAGETGVQVAIAASAPVASSSWRANVPTALPEVDPDAYFKGRTGGTFGKNLIETLPGNRRVAVAGFRVVFVTRDQARAQVRAAYLGGGRETSGASSTTTIVLSGVEAHTLQALADKAYADFIAQLKLAGRDVVPMEEMREMLSGIDATPSTPGAPFGKESGAQVSAIFSPAALPLWFDHSDGVWSNKGPFDQTNWRRVNEFATKMNAIIINPLIVVHFARMESSGNRSGFYARSAETGAALDLHVSALQSRVIRAEESRMGLVMKGDDGQVRLEQAIHTPREFATIRELSATDNTSTKGVMDALSRSLGATSSGLANRVRSNRAAETSDDRYAAAASELLAQATGTLAKWFQKYPAR